MRWQLQRRPWGQSYCLPICTRETTHAWNTLSQHVGFNSLECRRTCNIQLAKLHQMAECTRKCCSTIVLDVVLCHTRLRETTKARGGLNCRHRTYGSNEALAVLSHAPTAWQVPWLRRHQGCSLIIEVPRKDGRSARLPHYAHGTSRTRHVQLAECSHLPHALQYGRAPLRPDTCGCTTRCQSSLHASWLGWADYVPRNPSRRRATIDVKCLLSSVAPWFPSKLPVWTREAMSLWAMHSVHRCTHSSDPSPAGGRVL